MQHRILVILMYLILFSCNNAKDDEKLIIAVVGDGVNLQEPREVGSEYSINRAQGRAIWNGAKISFDSTEIFNSYRDIIKVVGYDDGGKKKQAIRIAKDILNNEKIIAVIGHSTSGTTIEPAKIYAKGNIPFLMPIATSPYAGRSNKKSLKNCFRLPLNDYDGQAPTVAYLTNEYLKAKKVALIQDISIDARLYSAPLTKSIDCLLGGRRHAPTITNSKFDKDNIQRELISGKVHTNDVVIFCGYGTNANYFMNEMRSFYSDTTLTKPTIILTDGCRIQDINVSGFESYLTFPIGILESMDCNSVEFQMLNKTLTDKNSQSYQLFGYDAMIILGQVIENVSYNSEVDRNTIINSLNQDRFFGACSEYAFRNGENISSKYYIYQSDQSKDDKSSNFKIFMKIDGDKLIQLRKDYGHNCELRKLLN